MSLYQYRLPGLDELVVGQDYSARLAALLAGDLDFHDQDGDNAARG